MHERRNFVVVLLLIAAAGWAIYAWFLRGETLFVASTGDWIQRLVAIGLVAGFGAFLTWAMLAEDRVPDRLGSAVGGVYYEIDGLCFMPTMRSAGGHAELCIYYQNRCENPAHAVVHLRPPVDSFVIRPGMRDAHFAFRSGGGDFGVIRQPIAVPRHLQGEVVAVELAAAVHFPRGQGARLCHRQGVACGTMQVDWQGAAFKTGVHEVSGEIELVDATTARLSMPVGVTTRMAQEQPWRQERLAEGVAA